MIEPNDLLKSPSLFEKTYQLIKFIKELKIVKIKLIKLFKLISQTDQFWKTGQGHTYQIVQTN